MKKQKLARAISLFLMVCLLCGLAPLQAFAQDAQGADPAIEAEVMDQRDRNTKIFKRSDNSRVAVVSAAPIHYWNDGRWVEIDNTLTRLRDAEGNVFYQNRSNSYHVQFPQRLEEGRAVLVESQGHQLTFEPAGRKGQGKKAKVKASEAAKGASEAERRAQLERRGVRLIYPDVWQQTDLEYVVGPESLKENIILNKAPKSETAYTYRIQANGLLAVKQGDGGVSFDDAQGQTVFYIPAPYMTDAQGAYSKEIATSFREVESGVYELCYTPSYEWLRQEERRYPVAIDPVVSFRQQTKAMIDTYKDSGHPDANYANEELLTLSNQSDGACEIYLDFSPSLLLFLKANIQKATVRYHQAGNFRFSDTALAALYCITEPVEISQGIQGNSPTYDETPVDLAKIKSDYLEFDFTRMVNRMTDFRLDNSPVMKVGVYQSDYEGVALYDSVETSYPEFAPVCEYTYTETTGLNGLYDQHVWNLGRAGTVRLNDFSRFLTLERNEISLESSVMPVQIKRIWDIGNATLFPFIRSAMTGFGSYWKTNYNRLLVYNNDPQLMDEGAVQFTGDQYNYMDADGTIYSFEKSGGLEDGCEVWLPVQTPVTPRRALKLLIPEDCTGPTDYARMSILDQERELLLFDAHGRMTTIQDAEIPSHKIQIQLPDANGRTVNYFGIEKIIDGDGNEYRFDYSGPPVLLSSISCYDPEGNPILTQREDGETAPCRVSYTYAVSGGFINLFSSLKETTFPDGEVIDYSVPSDQIGYLTGISDGETMGLDISYKDYRASRITVLEAADNEAGYVESFLDIESPDAGQTKFSDEQGNWILKQFDEWGQTLHVTDQNGNLKFFRDSQGNTYEPASQENLLSNPGFEDELTGWQSSGIIMASSDQAESGEKSAMFVNTAELSAVEAAPRKGYVLTASFKTPAGVTEMGASLHMESLAADGSVVDSADSETLGSTNGEWKKLSLSYQAPANTASIRIALRASGAGLLYADNIQLNESGTILGGNLISNPDFTTPVNAQADWETLDGAFRQEALAQEHFFLRDPGLDANVLGLGGNVWAESRAWQTVTINGKAGDQFLFAAWAMKMTYAHWDGAAFALRVEAPSADGAGTEVLGIYQFNPHAQTWQYGSGVFTLNRDMEAVTVSICFDRQPDYAAFDGLQLCRLTEG